MCRAVREQYSGASAAVGGRGRRSGLPKAPRDKTNDQKKKRGKRDKVRANFNRSHHQNQNMNMIELGCCALCQCCLRRLKNDREISLPCNLKRSNFMAICKTIKQRSCIGIASTGRKFGCPSIDAACMSCRAKMTALHAVKVRVLGGAQLDCSSAVCAS